jgi:hypothetical protein
VHTSPRRAARPGTTSRDGGATAAGRAGGRGTGARRRPQTDNKSPKEGHVTHAVRAAASAARPRRSPAGRRRIGVRRGACAAGSGVSPRHRSAAHTRCSRPPQLFPIRCYEVGTDGSASIVSIANLLQEVAANHAQVMWGEGTWAPPLLAAERKAFALSKLHIRMDAPVAWGATVRVRSWFGEAGSVAARRDWELLDAARGKRLGAATSTWLAFSLETRRMARLPPALRSWFLSDSPQPPRRVLARVAASVCDRELTCADVASRAASRWARTLRRSGAPRWRRARRAPRPASRAWAAPTWT